MPWDGVVHAGRYACTREFLDKGVAVDARDTQGILVEDVGRAWIAVRGEDVGMAGKVSIVRVCGRDACGAVGVEVAQFYPEQRRLEGVEPRVDADFLVAVADLHAVVCEPPHARGEVRIVREHSAAVAEAAEVFRGEEAGGAEGAQGSGLGRVGPRPGCAKPTRRNGLRIVLHDGDAGGCTDFQQGIQICRLAEEVHGHDGPRPRRHRFAHLIHVDVEGPRVYIHQNRRGAEERDDFDGRDEGESRGNHLIARSDVQRHESKLQGIRSVRARDDMCGSGVGRELVGEGVHVRPLDVRA